MSGLDPEPERVCGSWVAILRLAASCVRSQAKVSVEPSCAQAGGSAQGRSRQLHLDFFHLRDVQNRI